jgi:hypothetical protein
MANSLPARQGSIAAWLTAGAGFNLDVISVTKARNNPGD